MFRDFWGNRHVVRALEQMIQSGRIAHTLLFAGPEGLGKATLARRLGAALLPHPVLIERDDLSLSEHQQTVADREKWPADRRNQDPLFFGAHPDFLTFAPDGPLQQISIPQMRLLKDRAPYQPNKGKWRVFLIDHADRAGTEAANSLLKTLEEPPPHLILILTAENAFDLLPTIRSRAVTFHFSPLSRDEMSAFVEKRGLDDPERRVSLAEGRPGIAISLDLEAYGRRRASMLTLLQVAAGLEPFGAWIPVSESISRSKADKLELNLRMLYGLLRDVLILRERGGEIRNEDVRPDLEKLAGAVSFDWIRKAVEKTDGLVGLVRRNIQKVIALDSLILELRVS